jgi:hypothetical protein
MSIPHRLPENYLSKEKTHLQFVNVYLYSIIFLTAGILYTKRTALS